MPENDNTENPYILGEEIPEEDILPDEPDPPMWAGFGPDYEDGEPEDEEYEEPEEGEHEISFMHDSPNGFRTPFYQWANKMVTEERSPDFRDVPEEVFRTVQVRKGQPFRRAVEDNEEFGIPLPQTRGPLMLPDSFDPIANPDLEPDCSPGIPMHGLPPSAKSHEFLAAMAHDMAQVGTVMVARMRVAIGYESDAKMIRQLKDLSHAISKMYYITRENEQSRSKSEAGSQPKRRPGRPRKSEDTIDNS